MSARIAVDDLRVGMFVHLDLGWWAHPFALSSFRLASVDQIATIRGLGLTQVRWSPEKSALDAVAVGREAPAATAGPTAAPPAAASGAPPADVPQTGVLPAPPPVAATPNTEAPPIDTQPAGTPPAAVPRADVPSAVPRADVPSAVPRADVPSAVPRADVPSAVPSTDAPHADVPPADARHARVPRADAPRASASAADTWAPVRADAPPREAAAASRAGKAPGHPAGPRARDNPVAPDVRVHERRALLAAQREATRVCLRQYGEAAKSLKLVVDNVFSQPEAARQATEGLTHALLGKMMVDGELSIRVLAEARADRATAHALNVALISMLMGRVFGFSEDEMLDVGVGALLHDVGKLELPERVRHPDARTAPADQLLYREHVARGLAIGKRMGLSAGALGVIGQHHEMADGSGFPNQLNVDRMMAAARIVALVNRFDNLCDPALPSHALTPHEALSLIFAQTRAKFDASMLNAFIRMMGVYPPGSVVQLTDERYALVTNVNSTRPLKPRVLVYDPQLPADEALQLNLEQHSDLGIRRSLRVEQLPDDALHYLSPQRRVIYFFEPAQTMRSDFGQELAA